MRLHGLAPSTMLRLLALVNRLLPSEQRRTAVQPGHASASPGRLFRAMTGLTQRAAERYHQLDDQTPVSS
jgi:hypothetical protein